ncbi:MAG TPA: hypothetical protein VFZ85_15140 [Jiangellaceae bacterium]
MDPVIMASARKHGIPDDDILHAYHHLIRVFALDDLTMLIGGDRSGDPLEIGVATSDEGIEFIVHAMAARPKFLR